MRIINPDVKIIRLIREKEIYRHLENCGRICYKSEDKITKDSHINFLKMIIRNRHESVLEHITVSAKVICSRACSHQWVRHRIGSYSQVSQRYVNYNNKELSFIKSLLDNKEYLRSIEKEYKKLIKLSIKPEDARGILPNSTATEFIVTYNLRQWRHFLNVRCNKHAQKEIRKLAYQLLYQFNRYLPIIFEDIYKKLMRD